MSRHQIITAAWIGLAALAFVLGWSLKPGGEAETANADEPPGGSPTFNALPSAVVVGNQKEASNDGAVWVSEMGPSELFSRRPLESHEIVALGDEYRGSLDPIGKRIAFSKLIAGMTVENALEVRAQFEDLPADHPAFRDFHYAWGKIGGTDAVLHGADTRKPDMQATLAGWASADPAGALDWFTSLDKERTKDNFTSQDYLKMGLVQGLADTDADRAADFVLRLASEGDKDARKMIATVASKVMQSGGPGAAAEWTLGLPEGDMRNAATGHVAHNYARTDPEGAASWAQEVGTTRAMAAVGHEWAKQDGAAAVGWLNSMGDQADGTAYFHTFEAWVARDPGAASQHLVDMPPSGKRDYAINGMINRHRWDDPISAAAWAGEISNPEQRQGALTRIGEAYFRKDRAGAERWLPSSGLPADVQARLAGRK